MVEENIVLLVDSKAAIQAIASNSTPLTTDIYQCRINIKIIENLGKKIVFQWILSHVGIHGNKVVDKLAKKGSKIRHYNNKIASVEQKIAEIKGRIKQKNKKNSNTFMKQRNGQT